MFNIALYQPEIPPNTGNIIRLSANMGAKLHLIKPLGFELDDKRARRAGLDYHELANVTEHDNYQQFNHSIQNRVFACSTKGNQLYTDIRYTPGDCFLFGPETRGLPDAILHDSAIEVIKIPMHPKSRSLNLSNACAIILYEAWRQHEFSQNAI